MDKEIVDKEIVYSYMDESEIYYEKIARYKRCLDNVVVIAFICHSRKGKL